MDYQLHMSLQPMESTVVSVVMLPTFVGSMKGVLSITRIGKESERREKNVLPLYGYGGKSRLVLHRVLRNPDQQMWIYLDSDTLSYKFSIRNDGDAAAFIKISQGIEATGVSLSPPECIVDANSEVEIEVSLSATPDRLEHLLQKPSDSVIRVVALTVMHGDEAALHRLRRLYLTYDFDLSDISTACHSSLPALIGLFANRESDTLILKDPKASLETLWQDGIHQWNIGVLVERSVLEAMRLDTSLDFTGLRTDLEETTYNVTSLTVSPESLSLSLSSSSQDLLLLNSDSRNIGFHCVASQGLQVNPQYGRINSKSSMKLRVHWDSIIKSKEPLEVKVLTAHGCEIVVPVKCR